MLVAVDTTSPSPEPGIRALPRLSLVAAHTTAPVGAVLSAAIRHASMSRVTSLLGEDGVPGLIRAIQQLGAVPDIVAIEMQPGQGADQLMAELALLAPHCGEATQVFVIGHHNDISLYRRLKREGAADYLVAPFAAADLIRSIGDHILSRRESDGAIGAVTLVIGARGGVGATSIAANLAWLGARSGSSLLLDMSAPMSSLPGLLVESIPDLSRMLYQPFELDQEMLDKITMSTPLSPNLGIVSAESDFGASVDRRGIPSLLNTARKSARTVVTDFPAWLLGPDTLSALARADHLVLVATPDFVAIPRASAILREIRAVDGPDPVLVLNQAGQAGRAEQEWSVGEVARALNVSPGTVVTVPAEPKIFADAEAEGSLVAASAPDSAAAGALRALYARIAPGDPAAAPPLATSSARSGPLAALRDLPTRLLSPFRK
ncbi:hypothetical protein [Ancylobacter sp. FA202]|uniref:AAA family ATPase n=1 Tax=Ancylobacter sp. FA202 TaxID=1111106 RepID=UPI000374CD25|nr:hypothetical protein [Ancylobacter sp. FA202]